MSIQKNMRIIKETMPLFSGSKKVLTPRFQLVSKRFITLFEILIVMAVLAIGTMGIGFNVHRALREQHFKSEVELVVDYLRLAQNLMLIMDADVRVIFETSKNESSNIIRLEVDDSSKDNGPLIKLVTDKPKELNYIHFIDFHEGKEMGLAETGKAVLKFYSKGSVMSRVDLRLGTNESDQDVRGALQKFICLPGYPKPIFSVDSVRDDPACDQEKQADFEQKLTQFTLQEIQNLSLQK